MAVVRRIIKDDDSMYFYKDYRIFKDPTNNKWGIKNIKTDVIIVKCDFDYISWLKNDDMIEFTLDKKHALYRISDMNLLTIG